ncbi:hypothetical protein D3C76_922290 [compost metagenome]
MHSPTLNRPSEWLSSTPRGAPTAVPPYAAIPFHDMTCGELDEPHNPIAQVQQGVEIMAVDAPSTSLPSSNNVRVDQGCVGRTMANTVSVPLSIRPMSPHTTAYLAPKRSATAPAKGRARSVARYCELMTTPANTEVSPRSLRTKPGNTANGKPLHMYEIKLKPTMDRISQWLPIALPLPWLETLMFPITGPARYPVRLPPKAADAIRRARGRY